jgi:SAM-dependent methyltransferase
MPDGWHDPAVERDWWDARYAATDTLWSFEPNRFLVQEVEPLRPGRALDLACGEGRNALWLAARGWRATAVDFSQVALDRGRGVAQERGLAVDWIAADVLEWTPPARAFDLVAIFYLQLEQELLRPVLRRAADAVAAGGVLLVVGHDSTNLTDGYGGPRDPVRLFTPADVTAALGDLRVERAERVRRPVATAEGERTAIDALVRAVRAVAV